MTVKTYRHHYCERTHRTNQTLARCIWPRAAWIHGDGPYALLAWCRVLTVSLHDDPDVALESKQTIDASACGGRCTGRHEIVRLEPGNSSGRGRAIKNPGTPLPDRSQRRSGKHSNRYRGRAIRNPRVSLPDRSPPVPGKKLQGHTPNPLVSPITHKSERRAK